MKPLLASSSLPRARSARGRGAASGPPRRPRHEARRPPPRDDEGAGPREVGPRPRRLPRLQAPHLVLHVPPLPAAGRRGRVHARPRLRARTLWSPTGWRTTAGLHVGDPETAITDKYGALVRANCLGYYVLSLPKGRTVTRFLVVDGKVWGFELRRARRLPAARAEPRGCRPAFGLRALRARAARRAGSRPGSGSRRAARGRRSRPSRSDMAAPGRSRAPASGAPSSSPMPFVVVARPEIAPRCSRGISLNRRPHASVITVPPATATGRSRRSTSRATAARGPPASRPPP